MTTTPVHVNVLCVKEEELVHVLSEKDPVEVVKNLYRKCVISDTMRDSFIFLDQSRLEPMLLIRYLLRLVCKRVEEDNTVWDKFLHLLASMGASFNTVKKELQNLLNKFILFECNPHVLEVGETDIVLTSVDKLNLLECLAEKCYKWEEIAIILKLPKPVIEECRSKKTNILLLNEVLTCWLSGNSPSAPTLCTLRKALCGPIVSEHNAGMALEEQMKPVLGARLSLLTQTTDYDSSSSNPTITYQSDDTEVADGKSSLLFCQASPRQSVSYQWKRNGQSLSNSSTYSGVTDDILVVSHARRGTEGEYTCHVSSEGKEVCSNKIILSVHYSPIKNRLLDLYSVNTEVPSDSWPPAGTRTFTNLVLIKSSKEPTDITDYTVSRNPDKITATRQKVEYQQVFGKCTSGELILLEGRPGSGKTTLIHKLIKDWTLGHVLVDARWVMLITLRDLNNTTAETLTDILKMFCHSDQIVSATIEGESGEGLCFIIDGLDEYQTQDKEKSPIYQLLNKTLLPKAMVIVSSRPAAIRDIKWEILTKRIEVFGFTKNQIFEYIDSFPFDSNSSDSDTNNTSCTSPAKLKEYLLTHPNIFHLCYLPVNAAMICYLFKLNNGQIPITRTKLYEEFTRNIILRHLTLHTASAQLKSLQDLNRKHKAHFLSLCQLAFKMTVTSKQTISSLDINIEQPQDEDMKFFGLVTISRTARLSGFHTTYTFLHLTVQEFCTAVYISSLDIPEQVRIIRTYQYSRMKSMWNFYCGLVDFSEAQDRLEILLRSTVLMIDRIRLAFESQQPETANYILSSINSTPRKLFLAGLTPQDIPALDYFLANTSIPIINVVHHRDLLHSFNSELLLQTLHRHKEKLYLLKRLEMNNPLSGNSLIVLVDLLNVCKILTMCELELKNFDFKSMSFLSHKLGSLSHLKSLTFKCTRITSGDITALLGSFKPIKHVKLALAFFNLEVSVVIELGRQSQQIGINNIQLLNLSSNDIDIRSAAALAVGLPNFTELLRLNLSYNGIGDNEVKKLSSAIAFLCNLLHLNLSHNIINSSGVASLVRRTSFLPCLRSLYLRNNNIGPEGAAALAAALQHHISLRTLDLSCNNIGQEGAMSLASELHHPKHLCTLHLSSNNIDVAGASHIITAQANCPFLFRIHINKDEREDEDGVNTTYVRGLVSADDSDAIATLVAAAQHNTQVLYLDLGFDKVEVQPKILPTS